MIIRAFRLFNEAVQPGTRDYGIPHPAILFVSADGIVQRRFMEQQYFHRRTMATILADDGVPVPIPVGDVVDGPHVRLRPLAVQDTVYPGNRFALLLEITPRPDVHVYGPSAGEDYTGLAVQLTSYPCISTWVPTYPPADATWQSPLGEQVPVYTHPISVRIEVALANRIDLKPVYDAGATLHIEGSVRLQACSETECWPPEAISVAWTLPLLPPDLDRPPLPLQREQLLKK